MKTKLMWVNRNAIPTTIAIYRNNVPTANAQLSNPIANLPGTATEYTDTTAITGQVYYYVIATTSGSTTVYSAPIKVTMQYDTGPGPNVLQYGDSQLGYFGECTHTEMFTRDEMLAWLNPPSTQTGQVALPKWDKWIRNGKILFVPRTTFSPSVSFVYLYSRGAVYGTDDMGAPHNTLAPVVQSARISRGYYTFKIRLMTGVDDRNNPTFMADPAKPSRAFSEVADLCYPRANQFFPVEQRSKRHLNATPWVVEFGLNAAYLITCAELNATGTQNLIMFPANPTALNYANYSVSTRTAENAWKPVLELEQTDLVIKEMVI